MATQSNQTKPANKSKYEKDYIEALDLFQAKKYPETVEKAKHNLAEPNLSRYWQVKNCILAAVATTDFQEAEQYRLKGEEVWEEANSLASPNDEYEQRGLRGLRKGLDELAQTQREEAERFRNGEGEEDEDEEPDEAEDAEQLAEEALKPKGA